MFPGGLSKWNKIVPSLTTVGWLEDQLSSGGTPCQGVLAEGRVIQSNRYEFLLGDFLAFT